MSDSKSASTMNIARRRFLCGGGYTLLVFLGYVRPGYAQEGKFMSKPVDQFQTDFNNYGYERYLAEIIEKARQGEYSGGGRSVYDADRGGKRLQGFRRAWGLEGRYAVNWESLISELVDTRADSSRITRVRFNVDCGFPVVMLMGEVGRQSKGTVLLMHGMGTTPERSLWRGGDADYMRHIGSRLMQEGYSVVCPFFPHAGNFKSITRLGLLLAAHGVNFHNLAVSITLASLDVALRRKGTGERRVYCYGVSIGALLGLHASLLDRRIKALVLSGYLRDDRMLVKQGVYDSMLEQGEIYPTWFTPGAWRYGLEETINIWAPRPLFIEVGLGDQMSGVAQGRDRVLQRIQAAYAAKKEEKNLGYAIFNGAHEANGVAAINWLKRFAA